MTIGSYSYKIRTQFSFIADDHTLSSILSNIANMGITITGYMQTRLIYLDNNDKNEHHPKQNIVRLVAGNAHSETSSDLSGVRDALASLHVDFQEKAILQALGIILEIPGQISTIFGALWCKVAVFALYNGEENTLFVDTSDTCKALLILSQASARLCSDVKCEE
ncbi:MAG: hypothetical protein ABSC17_10615 [Thermacetogeniaceae bacterium]